MNNLKNQFQGFLNTAFLFDNYKGLKQFELEKNKIENIDFNNLDIPEKLPLGKRIERFFEVYIEYSNNYNLVKNNIQVINNKETLGEIDFILYDKRDEKYVHVEHVYKYYLYDESFENEVDRFIGPNRDDSFAKKIAKLKNKQLPLLYKNETQEYLESIDINLVEQKVCFKGNIYVPRHLLKSKIPIVNNSCIKGFYLSYEEFLKELEFKSYKYLLPARFDWVCDCSLNKTWKSFDEVIDEIDLILNHKKSTLVWMKNRKDNTTQSFFITWW